MREGATTDVVELHGFATIVAIRGERGSYNDDVGALVEAGIVAIRGERGSYNGGRAARRARADCSYPG